jgi:hypothetical protein
VVDFRDDLDAAAGDRLLQALGLLLRYDDALPGS